MIDSGTFLLLIAVSWIILIVVTGNKWINLKNPEIGLGFALFRTEKFNSGIDKVSNISKGFWRFFFDVGLLVCIGFLVTAILMFSINIFKFVQIILIDSGILPSLPSSTPITTVDFVPAIPGVSIGLDTLPFFFIAIGIAAALHELAHGVAARAEGIKLKSTGILFFLFFFGAFVEPDEKSVNKASSRSKLRVYAAGAFTNVVMVVILLVLLTPFFFNMIVGLGYSPGGALIVSVCPESLEECPADNKIFVNDVIIKAQYENGTELTINDAEDFSIFSAGSQGNESIVLSFSTDNQKIVNITTVNHPFDPSRGLVGVSVNNYYQPHIDFLPTEVPSWYFRILVLTLSLSLILALLNLLPVPPLDGDKIATTLLQQVSPKNYKSWLKRVRIFTLFILLGNLILTFVVRGWNPVDF